MFKWICKIKHLWKYEDKSFMDDSFFDKDGYSTYIGILERTCRICNKKQIMYAANWYTPEDIN